MEGLIIFTDLDGSLGHESYTASPADSLFGLLDSHGIPVIFNSSKTFPEMIKIRRLTANNQPFVVENGPRSTCHLIMKSQLPRGLNQSMGIDVMYLRRASTDS